MNDANANGILDRNECADLVVRLQNLPAPARQTASNLTASLTCATPGVLVDPAPRAFGDLPPDGTTTATASSLPGPYPITCSGQSSTNNGGR